MTIRGPGRRLRQLPSSGLLPRHLAASHQPMPLLTLLDIQILLLPALDPDLRKLKRLAAPSLQPLPHAVRIPIGPQQRANPRLHIPAQLELHIGAVLQAAADVRDLVLGPLVAELDDAARVRRLSVLCGLALRLGRLGCFGRGVDVVVLVPRGGGAGEDGVPDDGFGGGVGWLSARVDGFEVDEDLFRVPVEERAKV